MINNVLTYILLFSSAGVGCYGFKQEGFECLATNEIIDRRLEIQRINKKCKFDSGYISGDIQRQETKDKISNEIKLWEKLGNDNIDIIIATPPCQGMSVANHKKNKSDLQRNSLIVDMLTCPYVFDPEQARAMAEAGADILVAHMGLTTKGPIGAETAVTLDDCCVKIREIIAAGREVNPDILVICHGGPIADPEDAEYVIKNVPEIDGFFGASSIERLASERGMTAQASAFKAIEKEKSVCIY
ncbi:phosphoenolpyruvate hydrolase family protein [Peptoniphilus catoniae]|uniref:phosphoenolpyruvate hydrolase family protein n=1 Tax=Peptoniphilus catoniae TaxID=1660341 RepID=UPI0010FF4A67|nr:phosphoenolpyruvate hydrolase family protein [Peptoniphilus catoniae]